MRRQKSFQQNRELGTLYLVATPIGNLEDMTMRAIRILREADWIAAEDTRQTRKLLTHFEITPKHLVSYHEHNKLASGAELVRFLQEGQSVALVSDAGMPAISDPGSDLVSLAIQADIPVVAVPGANAGLSALIISGLDTDRFSFVGFLPRAKKKRTQQMEELKSVQHTIILYEAPHRLLQTLTALLDSWGNRKAVIVRELTKRHEEVLRGTLQEMIDYYTVQQAVGEICLLVEGNALSLESNEDSWSQLTIAAHVANYLEQGIERKEAMKRVAGERGLSKRDVYQALIEKNP